MTPAAGWTCSGRVDEVADDGRDRRVGHGLGELTLERHRRHVARLRVERDRSRRDPAHGSDSTAAGRRICGWLMPLPFTPSETVAPLPPAVRAHRADAYVMISRFPAGTAGKLTGQTKFVHVWSVWLKKTVCSYGTSSVVTSKLPFVTLTFAVPCS